MNNLDLDRLHNLALNGKSERRQGSTTLSCNTCINHVLIEKYAFILCLVEVLKDITYIFEILVPMLQKEGLDTEVRQTEIRIPTKNVILFFGTNSMLEKFKIEGLRGRKGDVLLINFIDR